MKKTFLGLIMGVLLINSCINKEDFEFDNLDTTLDGTYAVALFNEKFSIQKILEEFDSSGNLIQNNDGYLSYIASSKRFSINGSNFLSIPNQNIAFDFQVSANTATVFNSAPVGFTVKDSIIHNQTLNIPNMDLDSILLKTTNLISNTINNIQQAIQVQMVFENILNPSKIPLALNFNLASIQSTNQNINLSDYTIDFSSQSPANNQIRVKLVIGIQKTNAGQFIVGGQTIQFQNTLSNLDFKSIDGFFGNRAFPIDSGNVDIKLFDNTSGGQIDIVNPKLNLYFDNSFGFDVRLNSLSPFFATDANQTVYPITGFQIPFLVERSVTKNQNKRTTQTIQPPQSNIKNLVQIPIKKVYYGANAEINPTGTTKNFATDTSAMSITAELEIPFYGTASNFGIDKEFDFTVPDEAEKLEFAEIKLIIENKLGLALNMQLYFKDSLGNTLDSIFTNNNQKTIVESAEIDNNGKTVSAKTKVSIIRLEQSLLLKLKQQGTKIAELSLKANTLNNGTIPIKVYPEDYITVKAGLKTKLKVNLNELD
jgi:hypothetical protein